MIQCATTLKSVSSWFGASEQAESPAPTSEADLQPQGNAAAAADVTAAADVSPGHRDVDGGGGYKYRQYANGDVEILEGRGAGTRLPADSTHGKAITTEIGAFPSAEATELTGALGAAAAEQSTPVVEGDGSGWADRAWAFADSASNRVQAAMDSVSSGVGEQTSWLYDQMNHWWEGDKAVDGPAESPAPAVEAPAEDAADGFDAAAARKAMDELYEEYTNLSVTVVIGKDPGKSVDLTVTAKYRNFASNDDWLGAIEAAGEKAWEFKKMLQEGKASDGLEHSKEFAQSYAGKGTVSELETALEEASESGELRKKLDEAADSGEAETIINEFAQTRLGLDCVGFAWKMIETTGQFEDFTPAYGKKGKEELADTQSEKEGWIACRGMMASATDITDNPSSWRTMDVILDPTHIIVIYDIKEVADQEDAEVTHYHAVCMESAASRGVKKSDYLFNSLDELWYYYGSGKQGSQYVNASTARVMRLENNDAVEAIIERKEKEADKVDEKA